MTCLTNEIFRILPVFSQFLRNVKFYIFSHFHKELSLALLQMTKWEWSESVYPEGVAGEKGGVRGGSWWPKSEASRAKLVYHSAHFARWFTSIFCPLPPVRSLVPGYVPGALSGINNRPCLSIYFYIEKANSFTSRYIKKQSRAMSLQYKLFLIILYGIHYTV